ncbi:MAG: hypothetical protein WAU86_13140 [Oricola sp.]
MSKFRIAMTLALGAPLLAGCQTAEDKDIEGVTLAAGNAVAYNSALQIIDPWPAGVQDTNIKVPSDRGAKPAATPGDTVQSGGAGNTSATN